MKVLFIGGTGIISTASTRLATDRGIGLTVLNRGRRPVDAPVEARTLTADIEDTAAVSQALAGSSFDAVVDWIAFRPADIERDIGLFRGRTRQFVFISSASAYQKPVSHYLITESTPLANPYWDLLQIGTRDRFSAANSLDLDHAAMPNSVWMNWRWPTMSSLGSHRIWPFRIKCIASYPSIVLHAPSADRKPRLATMRFLMNRWSCSMMLFK
jgi:hypothetical protein